MKALLLAALLASFGFAVHAADTWIPPPFDPPLLVNTIRTGSGARHEIRCFTFAHFIVKEIDEGELGDAQISVIPLGPAAHPTCQAADIPGERRFARDAIADYFLGTKGDFVFLSADDGVDRGMGFAVYRAADNGLVFQEAAQLRDAAPLLRSIVPAADGLRLGYTRVMHGPCSVAIDGAACQARIAKEAAIPPEPAPDCVGTYRKEKHERAVASCRRDEPKDAQCVTRQLALWANDDESPSVIAFDVEVELTGAGPTVRPMGAAASCWPAG